MIVLIASNNSKLSSRWSRALRGKHMSCVVSQKEALGETLSDLKPGVLLIDVRLPRLRATRELPSIQRLSPATRVLVISDTRSLKEQVAILKAGAKGYCNYNITSALLRKAIHSVARGELWAARHVVSELIEELIFLNKPKRLVPQAKLRLGELSSRQQQVAALASEETGNKEIAQRLNISEATVKAHLTAIFRKFGISRRGELVQLSHAMSNGTSPK